MLCKYALARFVTLKTKLQREKKKIALSFKKIIIRTTKKRSYLKTLQHATTRTEVDDR